MASVAHKKRWEQAECTVKAACDGNSVRGERLKTLICRPCERALAKRGKVIKPRGLGEGEADE